MKHFVLTTLLCATLCIPALHAQAQNEAAAYGDTYTQAELDALAEALHAGNMTIGDMQFEKNYAKGHACFPIVHEMMKDPLLIARFMDQFASGMQRDGAIDSDHYRLLVNVNSLSKTEHDSGFAEAGSPAAVASEEDLLELLNSVFMQLQADQLPGLAEARQKVTLAMSWHDFEGRIESDNPEADAADAELYALLGTLEIKEIQRYADFHRLIHSLEQLQGAAGIFPTDAPYITYTPHGRIALGTMGDDYYSGDYAVLIDPGGDDHYDNCRIGAAFGIATQELGDGRLAFFADLGGDDYYDCADVDITLGAAVLGVAAFYDLGGGNDRYFAGSCSLGAAMGGIATFIDDGGSDSYSGKTYTQGAAGYGIGIMIDDSQGAAPAFDTAEGNSELIDAHERDASAPDAYSAMDNDSYSAWTMAQAFARTRGVALCINQRGNETYNAGGVYLHAPLFADRYQSFSQGFAIGERDIDYAGGIAMLLDYSGNDRYLGDIYNQGVGYWYAAGLLWDGGGNDTYEMVQYGQGSGIHLAIGGLVDVSGNDGYIMHSGLGQGGSHDFAASILHDRAGDDRYMGTTTCNGAAVTNSVGLHIDRSGNDTYGGRREHGINTATAARGFGSIGVLVDMAGKDDYLGKMADGEIWRHMDIGMGWDIADPEDAPATVGGVDTLSGKEVIPEIISYEGPLTQEVFDELWEISIRWEVGDNRVIVPRARERLAAWGREVLPLISVEMDQDSSLAVRGFVGTFNLLLEEHREGVLSVLRENAQSPELFRRKNALRTIGEMKLLEAEDIVAGLLEDSELERLAIGTLGLIGSHSADTELVLRLQPDTPEPILIAAIIATTDLKIDCAWALVPLLDHEMGSVRSATVSQLAKNWSEYGDVFWIMFHSAPPAGAEHRGFLSVSEELDVEKLNNAGMLVPTPPDNTPGFELLPWSTRTKRGYLDIHIRAGVLLGVVPADPESYITEAKQAEMEAALEQYSETEEDPLKIESVPATQIAAIVTLWSEMAASEDWGLRADAYRLLESVEKTPDSISDPETLAALQARANELLAGETNEYVLRVARGDV